MMLMGFMGFAPFSSLEDVIDSLFGDHHHRVGDVDRHHAGKDRGIADAQASTPMTLSEGSTTLIRSAALPITAVPEA